MLHATRKLLDRLGPATLREGESSDTALGAFYATVLFWRPQVALLVAERTLLPVVMPLAPAATLPARFPAHLGGVLAAHGATERFVTDELAGMGTSRIAATRNRSVVGVMTEFARLTEAYRNGEPELDLLELSLWLSQTPCGPLYGARVSPDRELAALLASLNP